MEVSQLKELKELREENAKLKRMYADQALMLEMAKDVISKKVVKPSAKRMIVTYLVKNIKPAWSRAYLS
ncbi:MAG: hypothetical protein IPL63_01430 [Saprospiraceae bacterium]|nr:hypothetical protein [Saprospiraceae bacterium]